jgi:hypothetical protein
MIANYNAVLLCTPVQKVTMRKHCQMFCAFPLDLSMQPRGRESQVGVETQSKHIGVE